MKRKSDAETVEWRILRELVLAPIDEVENPRLKELLEDSILDWGHLIEWTLRHKVSSLLAFKLKQLNLLELVPVRISRFFTERFAINKYQLSFFKNVANEIYAEFKKRGMPCIATKGLILEPTIYKGCGTREMVDIDFMILGNDRAQAMQIISDLKFEFGNFDPALHKIQPHSRRHMITSGLNPDHIPAANRLTGDAFLPSVTVDFATSFTWYGSDYEVPLEKAFDNLDRSGPMASLRSDYHFIFVVLHLFREAWLEDWLGGDVDCAKFRDVIQFWNANSDKLKALDLSVTIKKYKLEMPVAWVLNHTDRTFGTNLSESLELASGVSNKWLASANIANRGLRKWEGTMIDRLMIRDRTVLLSHALSTSEVKM